MKRLEQTSGWISLIPLMTALVLASCQDQPANSSNITKTVAFHDPSVDATVKSALENGSVSEVVVRKDLLLFPVNAPDLVIAHRQEIHAVPHNGSYNAETGKPTAAEVAEVNEYSLSQLVPTNDTDANDTESQSYPIVSGPLPAGSSNNNNESSSVLEPGQLLEIVSGFNLSHGMATEKVEVPSGVQNFSFPKQTIVDLLSKSLAQSDSVIASSSSTPQTLLTSYRNAKRSVAVESDESSRSSDESDSSVEKAKKEDGDTTTLATIVKRSVYYDDDSGSDESQSQSSSVEVAKRSAESDDNADDAVYGTVTEKSTSTASAADADHTTLAEVEKRSVEDDDDDDSDESKSTTAATTTVGYMKTLVKRAAMLSDDIEQNYTTEQYNPSVERVSELRLDGVSSNATITTTSTTTTTSQGLVDVERKSSLRSSEDMDVAEDIVFRPLFRYRQEMRVRQRDSLRAARSRADQATARKNYYSYNNNNNNNNNNDNNKSNNNEDNDDSSSNDYSDRSDNSDYD